MRPRLFRFQILPSARRIVPVAGYIFPFSMKDKISPPSVIGAGGLITNNGTRAFAFGGQLFVKENRYQITSAYGRGNIDYNIYGEGIAKNVKLPLEQTGNLGYAEAMRRVWWMLFVGPRFIAGDSFITIKPNDTHNFTVPPDSEFIPISSPSAHGPAGIQVLTASIRSKDRSLPSRPISSLKVSAANTHINRIKPSSTNTGA